MSLRVVALLLFALAACGPSDPAPATQEAKEPALDTPEARARFQLEHRLGGPVAIENVRRGTADSGRPMICGEVVAQGVRKAFVMGDYLILEDDASPAQMAALNKGCAAAG
jgi:hypothetical protein